MIIKNIEMFAVVMLLENKLPGKRCTKKILCGADYAAISANLMQKIRIKFFCNRFASGRFQFCKYSRRAMRGMNNRWVAGQREGGGRGRVMGGVERWRGV